MTINIENIHILRQNITGKKDFLIAVWESAVYHCCLFVLYHSEMISLAVAALWLVE